MDRLRKMVVAAMLHGNTLGIGIGNGDIDFNVQFREGPCNWLSETVFNFAEFRKKENYREILMDDDLKDVMGNVCQK